MKRFLFFAVAALVGVTTAVAQPKSLIMRKAGSEQPMQMAQAAIRQHSQLQWQTATMDVRQHRLSQAKHKAPRRAGIMIDQPEGTYHSMVYSCSYMGYNWLYGLYNGIHDAALGEVVEGTDGCLYIHNLVTEEYSDEGYWVKAEPQGDGNYVIHKQPIIDYWGTVYYIGRMTYDADSQLMAPADDADVELTWKDGVLRTADLYNSPVDYSNAIGVFSEDGSWTGSINWDITMEPQTDVAITSLPAGVEAQEMMMRYIDEEGNLAATFVKMAIDGNDVYLQYYTGIDSWIKGTVDGRKVSFPTGQYLGADNSYGTHVYFIASKGENMLDEVMFQYNAKGPSLMNSYSTIYANAAKTKVYYITYHKNPDFFVYEETPSTPMAVNPSTIMFMNYNPLWGIGYFDFDALYFDDDDNYLDPSKLSYRVYEGDKLFTFTPEEYPDLAEPITEVPYTLGDSPFWCNGVHHEFVFYHNLTSNIGIQIVYRSGDEVYESEITWYEVTSNAVTEADACRPHLADATANTELADGELALNLGAAETSFKDTYEADQHYDVAFHVVDPMLVGKQVKAVNVPFLDVTGVSGLKVWLSKGLSLDGGQFVADIVTKDAGNVDAGFTTVVFDEPYTITEEGVYVGYSFEQAYVEPAFDDYGYYLDDFTGIVVTNEDGSTPGGFLLHNSIAFRDSWASMYGITGNLALEAVITGADANAAMPENLAETFTQVGEAGKLTFDLTNYGWQGIQSADYAVSINGKRAAGTIEAAVDRVQGGFTTVTVDLPAIDERGSYDVTVTITNVNGQANGVSSAAATSSVFVMNSLPKKRPLMEEYTGTWCGYCPRGFVGLEKMNELYPDDFVALSYHNGDPMEVTSNFPSNVDGFPDAWLDRAFATDAYCGNGSYYQWGLEDTWLKRCEVVAPADIDVEACWAEDGNAINVKSTTTFSANNEASPYIVGYALVADGLTGTGSGWTQSNYYSGQSQWPADMDQFTKGGSKVSGLVFNDVVADAKVVKGIAGSLPKNVMMGHPCVHEYDGFSYSNAKNTSNKPVIQDKEKVRVVAMIIDTTNGHVVNANKCNVEPYAATAVRDMESGRVSGSTTYYDLSGRKVLLPSNGVYIQSVKMKNGQTVNRKVVLK